MSIVRVYKNTQAFDNLLMVRLSDESVESWEEKAGVTALFSKQHNLLGYNIEDFQLPQGEDGYLAMDETLLAHVNTLLKEAAYPPLEHDFTPRIVVGQVIQCEEHPDSDHLHICQVDVGIETIQIVCGAHNVAQDVSVVVARCGAVLPSGNMIVEGKLRGVTSYGMLCSAWELGLVREKQKGLLLLDNQYQIGAPFFVERMRNHV